MIANGQQTAQFLGPPRTAGYRPSLVAPMPLWSGRDPAWYSWTDVEVMRRDPQIQFGLRILRGPLATVTWEIPASSPEVAAWVDRTLRRIWTRYLNKVTAHLEYGSSGGESTWRYDRGTDLIELDELLDIHVLDMQPLQKRRKQVGVRVRGTGAEQTDLFAPRYWWVANEAEFGAYHGRARLSGAWIPWQEKTARHGARDVRRLWYVKNVMDGGSLYVPPGSTEVEQGVYKSNQDYGRELMEKALAGGVKVFPGATDEKGKRLWEYEAPKVNGELTGIHTLMEELDVEILVGLGIPPEVVQAADSGSGWSGRSVPFLVFLASEDQIADTTVQAIDKHVLRPGVAVNFGEDAKYEIRLKSLVKQAEEEEAKKDGQQPGAQPGNENESKIPQDQREKIRNGPPPRPPAPVRMSVQHAPAGGISIGGKDFTGGEFIPGDVLEKATPEEKAQLVGGPYRAGSGEGTLYTTRKNAGEADEETRKEHAEARAREAAIYRKPKLEGKDAEEAMRRDAPELADFAALARDVARANTGRQYDLVLQYRPDRVSAIIDRYSQRSGISGVVSLRPGRGGVVVSGERTGRRAVIPAEASNEEAAAILHRVLGAAWPFGSGEKPARLSIQHAPPGGVTIAGRVFKGGEFIPGEVLAKATKEELAKLKSGSGTQKKEGHTKKPAREKSAKKMAVVAKPPNFTPAQKEALSGYSGGSAYRVNAALREGLPLKGRLVDMDRDLQSAFASTPEFYPPQTVYRGVTLAPAIQDLIALSPGQTWYDPGYASTSRDRTGADTSPVSMEIMARHGIELGDLARNPKEGEVLLPRDSRFRVISVERKGEHYHVRLEQLRQPARLSIQHAPAGGISIGGQDFKGGEFIPGKVLEKATAEERAQLKETRPAGTKADRAAARTERKRTKKRREAEKRQQTHERKEREYRLSRVADVAAEKVYRAHKQLATQLPKGREAALLARAVKRAYGKVDEQVPVAQRRDGFQETAERASGFAALWAGVPERAETVEHLRTLAKQAHRAAKALGGEGQTP